MRRLLSMASLLTLGFCALATPLHAESPWSFGLNLHGGPTMSGLKEVSGNAGYTFGFSLEAAKKLSGGDKLVTSLGYQVVPGDNNLVSKYASTATATGINPTYYDMRMRKMNGSGFQAAVMYRADVWLEGFFLQGGLQLGSIKMNERDGGTRVTTNGGAVTNMYSPASANILAISTIQDDHDASVFSVGPKLGAGYMLNDFAAVTFNATMFRAKGYSLGSVTGWATEVGLNIRF